MLGRVRMTHCGERDKPGAVQIGHSLCHRASSVEAIISLDAIVTLHMVDPFVTPHLPFLPARLLKM